MLLFHVGLPQFSGGYAGVDVFFVISGYLITRNIQRELVAGTFSFQRFYLARLRRLYPALLATVALTLLFGALVFAPPHLAGLAPSAIASRLVFNIFFWSEVGYWDSEISLKPLLHIWSLSLEEQFYLVWPLLLFAASLLKYRRAAIALVIAGVGAASYYYAGEFDRTAAFYWMPLRANRVRDRRRRDRAREDGPPAIAGGNCGRDRARLGRLYRFHVQRGDAVSI